MTSSFDFNTEIAQLAFLNENDARQAGGYRGDWGLPLSVVAAAQQHTTTTLQFAGSHGAMMTHFSQFSSPESIAKGLYQETLVRILGVLFLGDRKETALISVGSKQDLTALVRRRRFVLDNHLIRIVPKRPFKASMVYMSNLPTQATEDKVENMLGAWGVPPLHVVLPTSSSGKALGFGFVTYRSTEQANKLIAFDGKQNIMGHVLTFERAKKSVSWVNRGLY